jgi:hypothetical protein
MLVSSFSCKDKQKNWRIVRTTTIIIKMEHKQKEEGKMGEKEGKLN